jgi:hypothetical protein
MRAPLEARMGDRKMTARVRMLLSAAALLLAATGCQGGGDAFHCQTLADCPDGHECVGEECVELAPPVDAGAEPGDAEVGTCEPEKNPNFCSRQGARCGWVTALDNCGDPRSVSCGTCVAPQTCGSTNVCICEGESDQELCDEAAVACGQVTAQDICGAMRTVSCADTCAGGDTCGGAWAANKCGQTTCTSDGWCRPASGGASLLLNFNAVWSAASDFAFAAGRGISSGHLYRWDGAVWRHAASTTRDLMAISGTGVSDAWIAGGYGLAWHWNGSTLQSTLAGCSSCDVHDLWALGPSDVWGVGYDHKIMRYDGSGWSNSTAYPALAAPQGVWAAAWNDVWVVGDKGSVRHYNGTDWTFTTVGTSGLLDVWGAGPSDIWAVGAGGTLLHYDGIAWTSIDSGTGQTLRAVTGIASDRVWFGGDGGTILHFAEHPRHVGADAERHLGRRRGRAVAAPAVRKAPRWRPGRRRHRSRASRIGQRPMCSMLLASTVGARTRASRWRGAAMRARSRESVSPWRCSLAAYRWRSAIEPCCCCRRPSRGATATPSATLRILRAWRSPIRWRRAISRRSSNDWLPRFLPSTHA